MKIINVKKTIRTILIILGVVLFINVLIPDKSYSYKELEFKKICVLSGDTLWSIAKEEQENNTYYEGKDIRDIIQDIKKINRLTSSNLKINEILEVPIY